MGKRTHGHQCLPIGRRIPDPIDPAAFGDQSAGNGQGAGGTQYAIADDARRHRRPRDHIGKIGLRGEYIRTWRSKIHAREAIDIPSDILVRYAQREHRFVVPHQPRTSDASRWRDGDQHVKRPARIPGRASNFPRRANVTNELAALAYLPPWHAVRFALDGQRSFAAEQPLCQGQHPARRTQSPQPTPHRPHEQAAERDTEEDTTRDRWHEAYADQQLKTTVLVPRQGCLDESQCEALRHAASFSERHHVTGENAMTQRATTHEAAAADQRSHCPWICRKHRSGGSRSQRSTAMAQPLPMNPP